MAGGVTIRMGPVGEPPIWVGEQPGRAGRARRANGRRIPAAMGPLAALLGDSPGMAALRERATRLLEHPSDRGRLPPLLIQGETGVGKGLLARALHDGGPRAEHRFVDVNCAAIPDTLLESELFGFERGAFTDARQPKAGLFQAAHHGTLFLDEVALLPEGLQAKLLKVLEDREVRRLGATRSEPVDAWIVTASNADLAGAVRARRFREDLYHRLAVVTLVLPPLRERGPDVLRLAEHFLARACVEYGLPPKRLAPDALAALLQHSWPGNVRELDQHDGTGGLVGRCAGRRRRDARAVGRVRGRADRARERSCRTTPSTRHWGPWSGLASSRPSTRRTGTSPGRHAAWESPATPCATGSPSMGSDPGAPGPRPRPSPPSLRRVSASPSRAAIVPDAPASAVRWEQRRVTLLRAVIDGPPLDDDRLYPSRMIETLIEKARSFGGRVEDLGPTGIVAVFGLEPVEDAAPRAAHAAVAIRRAVERGRRAEAPRITVRLGIHVAPLLVGYVGRDIRLELDGKRRAWQTLEGLVVRADPDGTIVSDTAAPFLDRRFALAPLLAASPEEATPYRLEGVERGGLGSARRLTVLAGRSHELEPARSLRRRRRWPRAGRRHRGRGRDREVAASPRAPEEPPERAGRLVRWAMPLRTGGAVPYLPIVAILRRSMRIVEGDSPVSIARKVRAGLEELGLEPEEWAPYLHHLLGVKDGTERVGMLSREALRARTVDALRQMCLRGSRQRPTVFVCEDLQWVDDSSEECLASLIEASAGASVLSLLTYRPGYRPPWMDKS